jgi:hypothetical protein
MKDAEDAPIGIVTVMGGTAYGEFEVSRIGMALLPVPATAFKDRVPITDVPPTTLVGESVKLLTVNGVSVTVAEAITLFRVARKMMGVDTRTR